MYPWPSSIPSWPTPPHASPELLEIPTKTPSFGVDQSAFSLRKEIGDTHSFKYLSSLGREGNLAALAVRKVGRKSTVRRVHQAIRNPKAKETDTRPGQAARRDTSPAKLIQPHKLSTQRTITLRGSCKVRSSSRLEDKNSDSPHFYFQLHCVVLFHKSSMLPRSSRAGGHPTFPKLLSLPCNLSLHHNVPNIQGYFCKPKLFC